MNKSHWDDIRYVLAVGETGSLNAAASRLGVTHATVMRRVALFEERYGQPVFQKLPTGYRLLPEAEPVLAAAREVRDAVLSVDRAFLGADQSLSGKVRITSTDSFCRYALPDIVKRISARYPELELTLLSTNTRHDILRLSADIAVRPTLAMDEGMTGRRACECEFALYSREGSDSRWLGLEGPLTNSRPAIWMQENVPAEAIAHRADSFLVLQELAASGLGKTILPRFVGDRDERLSKVPHGFPATSVPVWVATQEDLARNARFRAVQDILAQELNHAFQPFTGSEAGP